MAYIQAVEAEQAEQAELQTLRGEVEGDVYGAGALRNAIELCKRRIQHWRECTRTGTSSTAKATAHRMVALWQHELQAVEQLDQQAAVHAEQQCVAADWTVSYVKFDGGDVFKYTHSDGREQSTRPEHEPAPPARSRDSAIAAATTVRELLRMAGRECYAEALQSVTLDNVGDMVHDDLARLGVSAAAERQDIIYVFRKYSQAALERAEEDQARYTAAVENQSATLEREQELDAAREPLCVRTCLGLAMERRERSLSWETELVHLYHMTVDAQGLDYTAESAQLVAAARRTLGLDAAIDECHERPHCCDPEWIGERYLALLLKHRGGQLVEAARDLLPYSVALGISAMDDHLGMERTLGQDAWRAEEDLLRRVVADKRPEPGRRRLSTGSGALPFGATTGRALTKLANTRRPLPAMTQVPNASGYVPFRTDQVVMTCVAKGECTLEAVRFATGSNRLTRASFGLPAKGPVSIKALVQGARANPALPFAFIKQRPTTWAGLLRLPWGIYVGRATVGEHDHMIAYDAWRHIIFLGGDSRDPSAVCRGWFLDDAEIADPPTFERFMLGLLDGLWKNVDGMYRVDVHARKLLDTSYC